MLTQTEMQRILDQVNQRFDFLNKRIDQLQEQVQAKPSARQASKKQVEENT
jgi:uncharacterized coiled-coil protein SlyX